MIFQRVVLATLLPVVITGIAFEPAHVVTVSETPLCHNGTAVNVNVKKKTESFMDVKKFQSISTLCPVMLPVNPLTKRKMAFTVNPYRSESLTLSDGVMLTRCMFARGIVMAHNGVVTGIDNTQKKIVATIDNTQKTFVTGIDTITSTSKQVLDNFVAFCNERFTFADHIMPEGAGFSNAVAMLIAGLIAIAAIALEVHQRTFSKLSKEDEKLSVSAEAQIKKTNIDDVESTYKTTSNDITEEQVESVVVEKDSGETASEVSDDGSTFLQSPPPTPPRYVVDMNLKETAKQNAKSSIEAAASPKRKRKLLGFRLRKNKNKVKN
jgi:hypothetical protein